MNGLSDVHPTPHEHDHGAAAVAEQVEDHRPHLLRVAYPMLGSVAEARAVLDEVAAAALAADPTEVADLATYLLTGVARGALARLRARPHRDPVPVADPAEEADVADTVGPALLVVLERLTPAERVAHVLHDLHGLHFEDVAGVLGRTPVAARTLAVRARRRVEAADGANTVPAVEDDVVAERSAQREVVEAVLAAASDDDHDALLPLLDPDARVRADAAAVATGAEWLVVGADEVADTLAAQVGDADLVLLDGYAGARTAELTVGFTVEDDRVVEVDLVADPTVVALLDVDAVTR